ncbi:MAG TPA: DNA recombination protein RmuC [Gemmatimonadales bacterium]|jgi:DNA recombination protein RmuC
MDIASFLLGAALGLAVGALVAWLAGRIATVRILARLEAERQAEGRVRETFAALSAEALRHNNRSFLELAEARLGEIQRSAASELELRRRAVDDLVRPISAALERVDGKIREVEKERAASHAGLIEQLKAMGRAHQALQAETGNLVRALRAPQVRGRWGEIQLRRVVELAGMLDYCDFQEQVTAAADGVSLRPDLVVRLPGGKTVVVDAKAPMAAYLEAMEGPADEGARESLLRDHARQVREHMSALGNKAYWSQFQPAPDFVVMFLPGETFFSAACRHDPSLIEYGVSQQVIPASPTTLIALLRAIAYGWRQERIAQNAQEISDLGRLLHDRVGTMAGHFEDLRRALDRAVESYNRTVGSLESRVLATARRFKELGVTADELPEGLTIEQTTRGLMAPELAPPSS